MQRDTVYPQGHWSLKVDIPYSMGVKAGRFFFLSGQADLEGQGEVCHAGDLYSQSAAAVGHIGTIVGELGCTLADLVKLTVFYVNNGDVDEQHYVAHIAEQLGTRRASHVSQA